MANPGGSGCGNSPIDQHADRQTFTTKAKRLDAARVQHGSSQTVAANSESLYTGVTSIRLRGTVMDITNNGTTTTEGVADQRRALRQERQTCEPEIPTAADYNEPSSCGNVYVSGTYSKPLTIAAANDMIVRPTSAARRRPDANLTSGHQRRDARPDRQQLRPRRAPGRSLGLRRPTSRPVLTNVTIEAAILSLQHSFIVDNYECGTR